MKYADLRPQVLDGDLIAVRNPVSLLGKMTVLVTRSPYTHTAVALWLDGGLWIAEMDGVGDVLVPLSQYADAPFDVYRCPVDRALVRKAVLSQLRGKIGYGWAECLYIGLHKLFRVSIPPTGGAVEICSTLSAAAYRAAGWLAALPQIAAPCDVVRAIGGAPALVNEP